MELVVSVFLVVVSAFYADGGLLKSEQIAKIRVNRLQECSDVTGLTSHLHNLAFFVDPEHDEILYADGSLTVGEEVPSDIVLRVDYRKCLNAEDESCEKYLVTDLRHACKQIADETKSWAPTIKHIKEFNPHCPLQPGTYVLEEAPIDMSPFENMTEFAGHWQIELSFVEGKKIYGCVLADLEVYLRPAKKN